MSELIDIDNIPRREWDSMDIGTAWGLIEELDEQSKNLKKKLDWLEFGIKGALEEPTLEEACAVLRNILKMRPEQLKEFAEYKEKYGHE